jgi:hypothetical protein
MSRRQTLQSRKIPLVARAEKANASTAQGVQIALKVASPVVIFGRAVLTWTE